MDNLNIIHYFQIPSQGNIYSITKLPLANGTNKILAASLKREVYCLDFIEGAGNTIFPCTKEVLFTYIPNGAEIISIDAFNKSSNSNDIFVGITIIKMDTQETYLNIYSGEDSLDFNIDNIAQNCFMLELNFIPYHLYHTVLPNGENKNDIVWLLSGSDGKIHMYQESKSTHSYKEVEVKDFFPELLNLPSVVMWMDIIYCENMSKRITAYGCECGYIQISLVNTATNEILNCWKKRIEYLITNVRLLTENSSIYRQSDTEKYNLLVVNSTRSSVVFMDILNYGFKESVKLKNSSHFNTSSCSCVSDIDFDGRNEILIGTCGKELLAYKYTDDDWRLIGQRKLANSIFSIQHFDVTGDGVKELIVFTSRGVLVFQNNLKMVEKILLERLDKLQEQ